MTFKNLGLVEPIVRAVAAAGYATPTPIQSEAIPAVLAGRDVLGCAQTGTGKTGAFAMPILHRLNDLVGGKGKRPRGRRPRALVLCPTRELATQIQESFRTYGKHMPLTHAVVFGGVSQFHQVKKIKAGIDVLVATPGRLLDLMNQGLISLDAVEMFVLDEADRMLDMGFIHDMRKIVEHVPANRQTLLFSATMPDEIRRLADSILRNPVSLQTSPVASTAGAIDQSVYFVSKQNKPALLARVLEQDGIGRTLVFTRTKYGADKLVKVLSREGIRAGAIHGNKTQASRTRALAAFKSGKMPVLIATDIASRGIDVNEITHVVNFDVPNIAESYVHRIGRTARAGASGVAVTFCERAEFKDLCAIEQLIDRQIDIGQGHPDLAIPRPNTSGNRRQSGTGRRGGGGQHARRGKSRRGRPGSKARAAGGRPGNRRGAARRA